MIFVCACWALVLILPSHSQFKVLFSFLAPSIFSTMNSWQSNSLHLQIPWLLFLLDKANRHRMLYIIT